MGTSLTGLTPATTYDALIKVGDNGPLSATAKVLSDGLGNDSPLAMSTTAVGIGTTVPTALLTVAGTSDLAWSATTSKLVISRSGVVARLQNYDTGSASAMALQWDGGNVGIGTTTPARPLTIRSSQANATATTYTGALLIHDEPSGTSPHLGIGVSYDGGNEHSWIQSNNTSGAYALAINPAGGNVGIGTTTPNSKLEISAGTTIYPINITSSSGAATTTGISMGSFSGLAGGANGSVYIASAHNHAATAQSDMVFYTHTGSALTEKGRFLSTGGLTFNGDTAAANALDDYEEGTFTPTIIGSTTAGTASYTFQIGRYTKIGRMVQFEIYIAWSGGTGTGNLKIAGLPFTTSVAGAPSATIGYFNNIALAAAGNVPFGSTESNATNIGFYEMPSGGGANIAVLYDTAGEIQVAGTYSV
jgi:hypothetical protein